jgi:probable HAF family extracellular repeat protein
MRTSARSFRVGVGVRTFTIATGRGARMRIVSMLAVCLLAAAGCSADAGSSSDADASRAAYRVVDLERRGSEWPAVADMSRSGLLLVGSGNARWVYDTSTGATRDVPASVTAINSTGLTAGLRPAGKDASGKCNEYEVFLHYPDGTVKGLGRPVETNYGALHDCSSVERGLSSLDDDGGVIAHWDSLENGMIVTNVYAWYGRGWRKLQTLGGQYNSGDSAAQGVIVGRSSTPWSLTVPQKIVAVAWRDGIPTDLGGLGGGYSWAHGLNLRGQIVGESRLEAGSSHAFLWVSGRMSDLGTLPAFDNSVATSINIQGQVVGWATSYAPGGGVTRGVLFADGKVYDLNDLVDAHELILTEVLRIADNGVMVAYGIGAARRPVLLIPTGAPLAPDGSWRHRVGAVISSDERPTALALDATNIYWMTPHGDGEVAIKAAPKIGGPVKVLWSTSGGHSSGNLVVDGGHIWFQLTTCEDKLCSRSQHGIYRLAKTGGTPERMADGYGQFALNQTTIYSTRSNWNDLELIATPRAGGAPVVHATNPGLFVLDGTDVFFFKTLQISGAGTWTLQVLCVESSGRITELTAPFDVDSGTLLVDAQSIYIREATRIVRMSRSGGQATVLASVPPSWTGDPSDLAGDGRFLYWNQNAEGGQPACIARMPKDGGNVSCLDSGFWHYRGVRLDDTAVFYVRDNEIVRLAK